MPEYVDRAVFIYDLAGRNRVKDVMANCVGVKVIAFPLEEWLDDPDAVLSGAEHVVIAATLARVKQLLLQSVDYGFSVGILAIEATRSSP